LIVVTQAAACSFFSFSFADTTSTSTYYALSTIAIGGTSHNRPTAKAASVADADGNRLLVLRANAAAYAYTNVLAIADDDVIAPRHLTTST
jgi:hypothetical protein